MIVWSFLALLCIAIGFGEAFFNGHVLFDPLVWFVAAIAFAVLDVPLPFLSRKHTS